MPDAAVIAIILVASSGEHLNHAMRKAVGQADSGCFDTASRLHSADSKQGRLKAFLETDIKDAITAVHLSLGSHKEALSVIGCLFSGLCRAHYSFVGIAIKTQRVGAEKLQGYYRPGGLVGAANFRFNGIEYTGSKCSGKAHLHIDHNKDLPAERSARSISEFSVHGSLS